MANVDEFCQFARLGQTSKIQKYLQTHNVDINALNLYGESALSTATYHNQIAVIEYLLANKADPKLRLSAGHTAVHIACQLAHIPMLHLLLTLKKNDEEGETEDQYRERVDQHLYHCLRIKDHANLTPIHWAAAQESVSKRQKVFAYLDQRMPGVLDSRYDMNWFQSWAQTHLWVNEQKKTMKNTPTTSPIRLLPQLTNNDKSYRLTYEQTSSLPLTDGIPSNMSPRTSLHTYESTPRPPTTATTNSYYDAIHDNSRKVSPKIPHSLKAPNLPLTPITSRIVAPKQSILKQTKQVTQDHGKTKPPTASRNVKTAPSEKTPYSQRLSSMIQHPISPLSDCSIYRAERAHVIPAFHFPPSPPIIETKTNKGQSYDDMMTPISSKRPSHNLLSNIVPSSTTSSSENSSRQSSKPFASFGFEASSGDARNYTNHHINDTMTLSTIENYTHHDEQHDGESFCDDDYDNHQLDYLCKSASTLGLSTPGAYT